MKEKTYHFRDGGKNITIKANDEGEAWEKLAKQSGYNNVDAFYEDINNDLFSDAPKLLNSKDPLDYRNQINISVSKSDCEQMGGVWVKGYTKHIHGKAVKVDGYCREQQSIYHY